MTIKSIVKKILVLAPVYRIHPLWRLLNIFRGGLFSWLRFEAAKDSDPRLKSNLRDGFLRIRMTHKCNAKCKFCSQASDQYTIKCNYPRVDINSKILYQYLRPVYEQVKFILLTGGEPLVAGESFNFCRFIHDNYPAITLDIESNGILFDRKWQELCMDNLNLVHISLNASNEGHFCEVVQSGEAGRHNFLAAKKNLEDYAALLHASHMEVFTPDISMVITRENTDDVIPFLKLALMNQCWKCTLYFESHNQNYDENQIQMIKELMKLERLFKGRFCLFFRLFMDNGLLNSFQDEIDSIPMERIREQYGELYDLAAGRSMVLENEQRNKLRKAKGKQELSLHEEWFMNLTRENIDSNNICKMAFKELDLYADGKIETCSWIMHRGAYIEDYIRNGNLNVDKMFNNDFFEFTRYLMLKGDYRACLPTCPLNRKYSEGVEPVKYLI
jgi:molybdenum cofactor biosynthesis enzyme MoaA